MEMFERGFTTKISRLLIHTEEQHQNCNLTGSSCCTIGSLCICQPTPESLWAAEHRTTLELVIVTFSHKTNRWCYSDNYQCSHVTVVWFRQAAQK